MNSQKELVISEIRAAFVEYSKKENTADKDKLDKKWKKFSEDLLWRLDRVFVDEEAPIKEGESSENPVNP
jgi:hypothetical protein